MYSVKVLTTCHDLQSWTLPQGVTAYVCASIALMRARSASGTSLTATLEVWRGSAAAPCSVLGASAASLRSKPQSCFFCTPSRPVLLPLAAFSLLCFLCLLSLSLLLPLQVPHTHRTILSAITTWLCRAPHLQHLHQFHVANLCVKRTHAQASQGSQVTICQFSPAPAPAAFPSSPVTAVPILLVAPGALFSALFLPCAAPVRRPSTPPARKALGMSLGHLALSALSPDAFCCCQSAGHAMWCCQPVSAEPEGGPNLLPLLNSPNPLLLQA